MEEQPVPHDDPWHWSTVLWRIRRNHATAPPTVRVSHGIREYCTQCGEMIFADKIACVATIQHGQKWLRLHFHQSCYVVWERMEYRPRPALADKVVALSAPKSATRDKSRERQEGG
jgi:hypothetical protein